ncbi:MAG: hypothetical protein WC943_12390 [Elusimicrobiota bacterium]|jgi:hypothetical protein
MRRLAGLVPGPATAALAAVVALIAWPILTKAVEFRDLYRSRVQLGCLTNLAAMTSGLEGGGPVCPSSARPYRTDFAADAQVFRCDDPRNHLRVPMIFLRSGEIVQVRMTLPDFALMPGGSELATTKVRTVLTPGNGSVTVHLERKPWERFFVMPLAALAGFIALLISGHFAVDSHLETRTELAATTGVVAWLGTASRGLAWLGLWTCVAVWAGVLLAAGIRGSSHTRDITVQREQGRLEIQDRWFGRAWNGPEVISDIQVVAPVAFGKRYFRLYALFPEAGAVGRRFLFTVGEAEVGAASLLQRPPVVSGR